MQLERFFVGSVVGIGPRTRLEQNDRCTKLAGFSAVSSRRFVFDLRRPNGVKVGSVSWRPSCDQESHPKHMQVQNSKAMFMTTRSFTVCERLHVVSHNPRCLPLVISKNNKILNPSKQGCLTLACCKYRTNTHSKAFAKAGVAWCAVHHGKLGSFMMTWNKPESEMQKAKGWQ